MHRGDKLERRGPEGNTSSHPVAQSSGTHSRTKEEQAVWCLKQGEAMRYQSSTQNGKQWPCEADKGVEQNECVCSHTGHLDND